jgi:hypothetical protein
VAVAKNSDTIRLEHFEFWTLNLELLNRGRVALVHPNKCIPERMHGLQIKLRVVQRQHPAPLSIEKRTNTSDRQVSDPEN